MASPSLSCPRCGGSMEQGFIIDETHGTMKSQKWVGGAPEYSFWFGLKLRGKDRLDVATYRCCRCGYLESYSDR
jgi:predicted nucleic-acid-binding Zn-ribbon protein